MIQISDCRSRDEAKIWIIRNQFGRCNLPVYERSKLALKLKEIFAKQAKENQAVGHLNAPQYKDEKPVQQKSPELEKVGSDEQNEPVKKSKPIETRQELAKIAGVSHDTIAKVEKIEKQALTERKVSVNTAAEIAKMPEEEQRRGRNATVSSIILLTHS